MSSNGEPKPPEFLVEAEAGSELDLLAELAPALRPPDDVRQRLLAAVEQPPLRYAPFIERVSELWQVDEAKAARTLARVADERAWKRVPLPGVRVVDVEAAPGSGTSVYLVRFAAGLRYPRHRHRGLERVLVLEGGYRDSLGVVYGPGDLHVMADGSEHGLYVHPDAPCICAVAESGFEFTSPWLRLLQRLVGRGGEK